MSTVQQRSQWTTQWRKHVKSRAIEAMGGKCVLCGYNRCARSLVFHHVNPVEKSFNVTSAMSWGAMAEELKKCVMLCHNCHNELHDGLVELPLDAPRFDVAYTELDTQYRDQAGEKGFWYGKRHSEEARARMRGPRGPNKRTLNKHPV